MPECGVSGLRISVVVPVQNRRDQVVEAVGSALEQSVPVHEVIVVDDGSTDGSASAVSAAYPDEPRLRVEKQANRERGAARNRGIELAKGTHVAFLDSDDLWCREKLARQVSCLLQPGVAACFSGFRVVGTEATSEHVLERQVGVTAGYIATNLVRANVIATSTCIVDRELLCRVGMFPEQRGLAAFEDWDTWLRVACATSFDYVPEPLCQYHVHPGNTGKPMNASVCRQVARRLRHHVSNERWRSELRPAFALRYADLMDRDASAGLRWGVLVAGCLGSCLFGPGVMLRALRLASGKV